MEKEKKKFKFNKKLFIGLFLIILSTDRMFHYINFKISDLIMGIIILTIASFFLLPIFFPNLRKQQEEEKPKPKVYLYSKEEVENLKEEAGEKEDG